MEVVGIKEKSSGKEEQEMRKRRRGGRGKEDR